MSSPLPAMPSAFAGALGRPIWNETRALAERRALRQAQVYLAPGAGEAVVLVTGYLAPERSVAKLAAWFRSADYDVHVAAMGRNVRSSSNAVDRIVHALGAVGRPSILIGHSRGGQQCRVATKRRPDLVRQLVTLGAPVRVHLPRQFLLRASVEGLRAAALLGVGADPDFETEKLYEQQLAEPFDVDVPWTSIWSRTDGVVEWQACLDVSAESVEVQCSHTGLVASLAAFEAIAATLDP